MNDVGQGPRKGRSVGIFKMTSKMNRGGGSGSPKRHVHVSFQNDKQNEPGEGFRAPEKAGPL